eukprot:gene10701-12446_t
MLVCGALTQPASGGDTSFYLSIDLSLSKDTISIPFISDSTVTKRGILNLVGYGFSPDTTLIIGQGTPIPPHNYINTNFTIQFNISSNTINTQQYTIRLVDSGWTSPNYTFTRTDPTTPQPTISSATNGKTTGSTITLAGSDLDSIDSITIGVDNQPCTNIIIADGGSLLYCLVKAGVGANLPITIGYEDKTMVADQLYSYAPPTIASLVKNASEIAIHGQDYGSSNQSVSASICGQTVANCILKAGNLITCPLPSVLNNNTCSVSVSVANQLSNIQYLIVPPVILYTTPNTSISNGDQLVIIGQYFNHPIVVLVDQHECLNPILANSSDKHQSITCTLAAPNVGPQTSSTIFVSSMGVEAKSAQSISISKYQTIHVIHIPLSRLVCLCSFETNKHFYYVY